MKTKSPFKNKNILITGGTGSFGSAFVENILKYHNPKKIVIYSRDEFKQYELSQKLKNLKLDKQRYLLGDVRDSSRLDFACKNIDMLVHAAALKQVPAAEYNPIEFVKTNIYGAESVVNACVNNNVEKIIALSTDKAANPINLYGATKLASDKIFVSSNSIVGKQKCKFSVVRYGNVLGSRGSVLNHFMKILENKDEKLTITDKEMTRFWITINQGVEFVINSFSMMQGGEIFIPKIPSMKIIDFAKALDKNRKHIITGIRPGEKLHEVMLTKDHSASTIDMKDRYVICPTDSIEWWGKKKKYYSKHKKVKKNFEYTSDNNTQWLSAKQLKKLIDQ